MGNAPNILCPIYKEQKLTVLYFIARITPDFISEQINLKYAFNIPFKITLKPIIMETSSPFHDDV